MKFVKKICPIIYTGIKIKLKYRDWQVPHILDTVVQIVWVDWGR